MMMMMMIIIIITKTWKYWVDVQGGSLISWGEGSSLTLVGNPSVKMVSRIKLLVWRHLKTQPSVIMSELSSNEIETNNINGSRLADQGPLSSRCSRQGNTGCHHTNPVISKRRK